MKYEEIECQGRRLDQIEDSKKLLAAVGIVGCFFASCGLLVLLIKWILTF